MQPAIRRELRLGDAAGVDVEGRRRLRVDGELHLRRAIAAEEELARLDPQVERTPGSDRAEGIARRRDGRDQLLAADGTRLQAQLDPKEVQALLDGGYQHHHILEVLVAVPLFAAPRKVLELLGWTEIDPAMSRVVAAALFAIGVQSLVGRGEARRTFQAMLNLKLIWSSFAIVGILVSLFDGAPPIAWGLLGVFVAFSGLWWRYWLLLRRRGDVKQ